LRRWPSFQTYVHDGMLGLFLFFITDLLVSK
jgi:hypothetical protein